MKNRKSKRKHFKHTAKRVIDFKTKRNYHKIINRIGGIGYEEKIVLYFNANNTFA